MERPAMGEASLSCSSKKQSLAVVAWKQRSGQTGSKLSSETDTLGGALWKMIKAVSRRNMYDSVLGC